MRTYLAYTEELQGYRDVGETVKAVESIAASRVHALRQQETMLDSYATSLRAAIARLCVFYDGSRHPLLSARAVGRRAVVILTSDRGLVGGLWHGLVGALIDARPYDAVFVVGEKGALYLREEGIEAQLIPQIPDELPQEPITGLAEMLVEKFRDGTYASVDILYPHFVSLGRQEPLAVPFLPFSFSAEPGGEPPRIGLPIFEPSKAALFDRLLRKYLRASFERIVFEAKLSELAARTLAAENASTKTDELMRKLKLDFMKERHRDSTQKQLENFAAHTVR